MEPADTTSCLTTPSAQVTPGADCSKRASPEEVASYTLKLLKRRVPPAVPGLYPAFAVLPQPIQTWCISYHIELIDSIRCYLLKRAKVGMP